jgi:hypothetical protein
MPTAAAFSNDGAKLVSLMQACLFAAKQHSTAIASIAKAHQLRFRAIHCHLQAVSRGSMKVHRSKMLHAARLRTLPSGTVLYRIGRR